MYLIQNGAGQGGRSWEVLGVPLEAREATKKLQRSPRDVIATTPGLGLLRL